MVSSAVDRIAAAEPSTASALCGASRRKSLGWTAVVDSRPSSVAGDRQGRLARGAVASKVKWSGRDRFVAQPRARCLSLLTQLTDAQLHVQVLEATVKSLQAMSHVSCGGRAGLAASGWLKALAALLNGLMVWLMMACVMVPFLIYRRVSAAREAADLAAQREETALAAQERAAIGRRWRHTVGRVLPSVVESSVCVMYINVT